MTDRTETTEMDADADRVVRAHALSMAMPFDVVFRRYLAIYAAARHRWGYAFISAMDRARERERTANHDGKHLAHD